ncbi:MAG: gliding motility-associated C-terminal domain-containing protein [Saprospiraceae bacterium]|nr:gliding motility-associated C-terminal domain-containing protein [Saprospiraceae bacterium]
MEGKGQCAFEGDVIIADLDTTSIAIIVSGADSNDLAINNSLKAVTVHFKHQFIGDMRIELVSPSGQKVMLVGPTATLSPSTSLVFGWNVQFFASSLEAFPDSGYEDVWDNLQTWFGFKTYVGKYYPHQGMLEDFNEGPVNGEWTFNIIDEVQFGTGHVYCLDLTFCEEDSIIKETCSLVNHTLSENAVIACENAPELNLEIDPETDESINTDVYGYGYALFQNNIFEGFMIEPDLTSIEEGTYTLCGIQYYLEDLSVFENIELGETKAEIESMMINNVICASFSEDCIEVIIEHKADVITETRNICLGDSVVINNIAYSETGIFEILTVSEPCDSISILDLTVNDVEVLIDAENLQLTCEVTSIQLDASLTSIPNGAAIEWLTVDGNIVTDENALIVDVDRGGLYTFEVSIGGCIFSKDIEIVETDDFVEVDLSTNVLTCILDSTFIDLTVSDTIDTIAWSGPFEFSTLNEDIRVGAGGVYTVNFVTIHGCEVEQEIEVVENIEYPDVEIMGDILTCTNTEVVLSTFPADVLGSTFQWFDEQGQLSNDTFLVVSTAGLYSLAVTTELGCEDTLFFEVISEIQEIEATLISNDVDCTNTFVTLAYSSNIPGLNPLWTLPNQELVIDSSFISNQIGEYSLTLDDGNGCILDTTLMVALDSVVPEVSIFDASFFCGADSIQLTAQTNFSDVSYVWTRPDGIEDTSASPIIFSPGEYWLEVCRPNGCCARDTIDVGVDNTVPSLTFEFDDLNCNNDTVYIIPSDTSSFVLEWSLNGNIIAFDSSIIQVTSPGFYEVLVINEVNGCTSKYSFDIDSDFTNEIESLQAATLNCAITEVQIFVTASREFENFSWDGPGLIDSALEPMVNLPGEYILDYEFTNGCTGSDTIIVIKEGELPNLQADDKTITCNEDEVTLNVEYSSSSIALSWTGPNFTGIGESVQVSEPGIYTVIGVAAGSCRDTLEIELFADTLSPIISIVEDGEITCSDSIVQIIATVDANTASYELTGPDISDPLDLDFEIEIAGIYTIEAVGFNGCVSTRSVEVQQSTDFPEYSIDLDSLTCIHNEVTVGFSATDPNLNVDWQGPISVIDDTYTFTTNEAGIYTFAVTNANGCIVEDSFFVFLDTFPPDSEIELSSHINCINDEATLSFSNFDDDWGINWTGPGVQDASAPEFQTGEVGMYTLQLTASNGCVTEDMLLLEYDTLSPQIEILGDPINCAAGKTFLRVDSDLTISEYFWSGPNLFDSKEAEPLIFEEGIYAVTVISENGCSSSDSILVEDERIFPEIEVENFYLPCDGAPEKVFTTLISEGAIVKWYGPNEYFFDGDTAMVVDPGEYIGIAFNAEGCTTSDTFQVIDEPILPEFNGFAELLLCFGPIPITAMDVEDDRSLYWNGPNGFYSEENPAMVDEPGLYKLVVTSSRGCVDSMEVEVIDGRLYPDAIASLNDPFQCDNLEVHLSGAGSSAGTNFSVSWTTEDGNIIEGENSLSPKINEEGIYILAITDNTIGCISYDTLDVQIQEQSLQGPDFDVVEPTCFNFGNAEINITAFNGGFSPFTIFVDEENYGERTNIQYLTSGEHMLTIVDSLGCFHDTLVFIPDDGLLTVELPADTTLCFGDSIVIEALINFPSDSIQSIQWSDNVPCIDCTSFTMLLNEDEIIIVEVTDINGCMVEAIFNLEVDRPNNLPFPQIFSPNQDNINDVFYLPMTKGIESIDYIKIYDNWGGLLFVKEQMVPGDESQGWQGTIDGKNVEQGVYLVEALVTLVDGSKVTYIGDLTLIR